MARHETGIFFSFCFILLAVDAAYLVTDDIMKNMNPEEVKNITKNMEENILPKLEKVGESVKKEFENTVIKVDSIASDVSNTVAKTITDIKNGFENETESLSVKGEKFVQGVSTGINEIGSQGKKIANDFVDKVEKTTADIESSIKITTSEIENNVKKTTSDIVNNIKNITGDLNNAVADTGNNLKIKLEQTAGEFGNEFNKAVAHTADNFKIEFGKTADELGKDFKNVVNDLMQNFKNGTEEPGKPAAHA